MLLQTQPFDKALQHGPFRSRQLTYSFGTCRETHSLIMKRLILDSDRTAKPRKTAARQLEEPLQLVKRSRAWKVVGVFIYDSKFAFVYTSLTREFGYC